MLDLSLLQKAVSLVLNKKRQSWLNVALCALITFLVLSTPAILLPVMYSSIVDDTGWSLSQVTMFSSLKFLSGAIASLVISTIIVKVSAKKILLSGVTLSGLALLSLGRGVSPGEFQVLGFVLGAASIATSLACKVILGYWFKVNLGKATGLAFMGGSVGGVTLPLLALPLIDSLGWQWTGAIFGLVLLVIVAPLTAVLLVEKPDSGTQEQKTTRLSRKDSLESESSSRALLRDQKLRALLFAQFMIGFVDYAFFAHTPLFLELEAGLELSLATVGMSVMMLASMAGKVGFGALYDRYDLRGVTACWWLATLGVAAAFPVAGTATLLVFALLRGFSHGGAMISGPSIALHTFGPTLAVRVVCYLSVANMLGASIGTSIIAYIRDVTGSYDVALQSLLALGTVASLIMWHLGKTRRFAIDADI